MKNLVETEVKIEITDIEKFVSDLVAKGASFKGKDIQRTIRMDTPSFDLEKKKTFLRVRSGLGNSVTLKIKKEESNDFKLRDEYETKIENVEVLAQIFTILGFSKHFIMEKYRADFQYKNIDISIDELPFGIYVEFEGTQDGIIQALKDLGLDKKEKITVTYWHMFDEVNKKTGLKEENILFPVGFESKIMMINMFTK